jgi:hypothetical protein
MQMEQTAFRYEGWSRASSKNSSSSLKVVQGPTDLHHKTNRVLRIITQDFGIGWILLNYLPLAQARTYEDSDESLTVMKGRKFVHQL